VDYELARLGRSLREPVSELSIWACKNRAAIVALFVIEALGRGGHCISKGRSGLTGDYAASRFFAELCPRNFLS
jgi:hypothetical protein